MKRGRSKWEIISDILKVTQEEGKVKKTRIMQRAYLDWRNFQRYFDFLLTEGFIAKCNPDPEYYEITEKGRNLSKRLKDVAAVLDLNGSFGTKK
ncbi:Winged helix-turn-helix [uncultured archaeon]|nr:Winged helix-turn-helix [uncultured archaeon]